MHGKKINVDTIVFQIKKVIQSLRLQKCLILRLSFFPQEGERGLPLR